MISGNNQQIIVDTQDKNKLIINASGKNGNHGVKGESGSCGDKNERGEDGSNGYIGEGGQSGKNISLTLSADEKSGSVSVDYDNNQYVLPLGDLDVQIITNASGGAGGQGGKGGNGGHGGKGSDGSDATENWDGEDGHKGGDGGNGGDGGQGGLGGDAGDIEITVKPQDTDLLMLVVPECLGGNGGVGGSGGCGGKGGEGGMGGDSHTWTQVFPIGAAERTNSGGSNGSRGENGAEGKDGEGGLNGKNGQLTIKVGEDKNYPGVYDLLLEPSVILVQSLKCSDEIIEPGESLMLEDITLKNSGQMPTPNQPIQVSLVPNEWIDFKKEDQLTLATSLNPSESTTLTEPLRFRVQNTTAIPAVDTTFHSTADLKLNAELSRVNKSFKPITEYTFSLPIRYPVEISSAAIPSTISPDEEAPFVIKLQNVSSKELGYAAMDSRLLTVSLAVKNQDWGHLILCQDEKGAPIQTLEQPFDNRIACLKPDEIAFFSGTLKLAKEMPTYTPIALTFRLHLGKLNNEMQEQQVIQERNVQLQLADSFEYNPAADIVLVTNNQTEQKTIESWQETGKLLGTPISIWNASLYSGLSYTQKRLDQGNFIEQMKGKVIVILNNKMIVDNNSTRATDCLDAMEILQAAKDANVATYVIGGGFDLQTALIPMMESKSDQKYTVSEKLSSWHHPNRKHFFKNVKNIQEDLQKENPEKRYIPVCDFGAVEKETSCFSLRPMWELGKVEMRETVDQASSHIAIRETDDKTIFKVTHLDIYSITKLMPFEKKLKYLERVADPDILRILHQAILSDLSSEILAYAHDEWNGHFTRNRLVQKLIKLDMFAKHELSPLRYDDLKQILLQLEYFANRLQVPHDKYLFPHFRRRTRLKEICCEVVTQMLEKYFPHADLSTERGLLLERWIATSREKYFKKLTLPFESQVTFDNQVPLGDPVYRDNLPIYHAKKSVFTEKLHFFADSEARARAIDSYKPACLFEFGRNLCNS